MPEATLKAKLTGDSAEFQRSLREGIASSKEFGREVASSVKEALAQVALLTIGVEGIKDALDKSFENIKGVFDMSKDLERLHDRTGIATKDLVQLQTEFKLSGLEADQVGQTINKMQRSIENAADKGGAAAKVYSDLGINLHDLKNMSPAQEFETIREKIAGIEDPAKRAQAAMEIFGKSGGQLLALFGNAGIAKEAANALGGQADILARNSEAFNQVAAAMEAAGIKIQGFFVGLAEPISHVILPVLNKLESVDLTGYGAKIGNGLADSVRVLFNSFEDGKLSKVVELAMKAGFQTSGNFLAGVLKADGTAFGDIIIGAFNPEFAANLGKIFIGVAEQFGGALMRAINGPLNALQSTISYEFDKHDAVKNARAYEQNAGQYDKIADAAFRRQAAFQAAGNVNGAIRQGAIADDATAKAKTARDQSMDSWNLSKMSLQDYILANKDRPSTFYGLNAGEWTNSGKADVAAGESGLAPALSKAVSDAMTDINSATPLNIFGDSASKELASLYDKENRPVPGQGASNGPDSTGLNFDTDDDDDKDKDKTKIDLSSAFHGSAGKGGVSGFHKEADGTWAYFAGLGQDAIDFHNNGSAARAGRTKDGSQSGVNTDEVIKKMGADISSIKSQLAKVAAPA